MRIGIGYDVHRLAEGRPLILGGVNVPHGQGLTGHSDADVLVHAVMDALLGAAGAGDIGRHFPDSSPEYKDISSLTLLSRVGEVLKGRCMEIINIDSTIIAEQPRLAAHIPNMIANIADTLGIARDSVNVKATTEEGLGFTGSGKGIAAQAAAVLEKRR
jgi:2-C-methyl-D-erythritol 2,4-cyclodiphosphate synthase